MNGRNRSSLASHRNENGKLVSGNPIGKAFYQVLQLLHHIGVVKEQSVGNLPKSFAKKTDHLNAFVRPARPDNSIKRQIQATNLAWATDIGRVLLSHYQTTLKNITQTLANSSISKENFLAARQTALQWGKRNFGNKLHSSTLITFGNIISNLNSNHHSRPKSPRQEYTRGKNGSYPAPRHTHNISSTANIPGSTKILFRHGPATIPFMDSETFLSNITSNLDPASNDYQCEVCLPDSNATFASGTHALAYSQAIFLDLGPQADAIFAAKSANEVHSITRKFPINLPTWKKHAHGILWQIFHWKINNVPAFTQRVHNSGGKGFIDHSRDQYWGLGTDGKGNNEYGKSLSAFRDHQTLAQDSPQTPPPIVPIRIQSTHIFKPTPTPRKRTSTPTTSLLPPPPYPYPLTMHTPILADTNSPVITQASSMSCTTPSFSSNEHESRFPDLSMTPSPLPPTPRPRAPKKLLISDPTPNTAVSRDKSETNTANPKPLYSTVVASPLKIRPLLSNGITALRPRTIKRNIIGRRPGPRCSHISPSINNSHQGEFARLISRPNSSSLNKTRSPIPMLMTQGKAAMQTTPSTGQAPRQMTNSPTAPTSGSPANTQHNCPVHQHNSPDHTHSRPHLAKPISRTNNPSVFTAKLKRHENTFHKNWDWRISNTNSQILILGDSNLSRITTSPNNHVSIESFPGAKIAHMKELLTNLEDQPSTEPEYVILSIGINDRENNPVSTSIPNIRKMAAKANQTFPKQLLQSRK